MWQSDPCAQLRTCRTAHGPATCAGGSFAAAAAIRSRRLARSSSRGRDDVIGCDKAHGQRRPDRASRARIAIAARAAEIVAGGVELRSWPVVHIDDEHVSTGLDPPLWYGVAHFDRQPVIRR